MNNNWHLNHRIEKQEDEGLLSMTLHGWFWIPSLGRLWHFAQASSSWCPDKPLCISFENYTLLEGLNRRILGRLMLNATI